MYQKAKSFNSLVYRRLKTDRTIDTITRNQLRKASLGIMLNIPEGVGRYWKADRRTIKDDFRHNKNTGNPLTDFRTILIPRSIHQIIIRDAFYFAHHLSG
ncbi:MAG: four helix bundle protein [Crocinitomicaceae bacterium]|nr:four helix bundle protein [Crocinitomicaceae bacterium]